MYELTIAEAIGEPPLFQRSHEVLQFAMADIIPLCITVGGFYAEINNTKTGACVLSAEVHPEVR